MIPVDDKQQVKWREGWARHAAKQTGFTFRRLHKTPAARSDTPGHYQVVGPDGRVLVEAGSLDDAYNALRTRLFWKQAYHHVRDLYEARQTLTTKEDGGATAEQVVAFEAAALVEIAAQDAADAAEEAAEEVDPSTAVDRWRTRHDEERRSPRWLRALDAAMAAGARNY